MDRGAWWATVHGVAESGRTERLGTRVTLELMDGPARGVVCCPFTRAAQDELCWGSDQRRVKLGTVLSHDGLYSGSRTVCWAEVGDRPLWRPCIDAQVKGDSLSCNNITMEEKIKSRTIYVYFKDTHRKTVGVYWYM